jgi:hypothetical protein
VRAGFWLRGVIGPLVDRESRANAKTIDRATADMVAERGAFHAGLQPRDEPAASPPR